MEKKTLPQELEAVLTAQAVRERPIRLMFQDEARFGRMARIRRCWAPAPLRPVVCNGYEREFTYVYGSVSPWHGELDWSLSDKMNTAQMAAFLSQVSQAHPQEFLVMVVDGASSHRAKELVVRLLTEISKSHNSFLWRQLTASGPSCGWRILISLGGRIWVTSHDLRVVVRI